jgi:hypothetical protein
MTEPATTAAERWVAGFAEGWRAPAGADGFADHFTQMFTADARLVQPQLPDSIGPRGLREDFARPLFSLIPDLHGEVERWAARGNTIYIDVVLHGTLGGKPITIRSCDRITLDDEGLATERVANADPLEIIQAVLTRPRAWPAFARFQYGAIKRRLRR